jgi:hypothetical protein
LLETSANRVQEAQADSETLRLKLEEARSQLAEVIVDRNEVRANYAKLFEANNELRQKNTTQALIIDGNTRERKRAQSYLEKHADQTAIKISKLEAELETYKQQQNPTHAINLAEPADLLNQLKGKRKKSKVELADVETILEILEGA